MKTRKELMQIAGDAIAQSNRHFVEAAGRGEAGGMASLYTDDADLLPPNAASLRGQAAIERFWHGGMEMGVRGLELETLRLKQVGGLVYEIGRYTVHFEPEGGAPVTDVATYLVVHTCQPDGSWRRAAEVFTWEAPLSV
jgi:ketosteroid isomerase-like protein